MRTFALIFFKFYIGLLSKKIVKKIKNIIYQYVSNFAPFFKIKREVARFFEALKKTILKVFAALTRFSASKERLQKEKPANAG